VRTDRLALGTLCKVTVDDREVVATVVGTWAFTGASGIAGTVETRSRKFRSDPQTDEAAQGYLMLPSEGSGFFYLPFGAVHTGDIVPLS
jgi:hypothetical protein